MPKIRFLQPGETEEHKMRQRFEYFSGHLENEEQQESFHGLEATRMRTSQTRKATKRVG